VSSARRQRFTRAASRGRIAAGIVVRAVYTVPRDLVRARRGAMSSPPTYRVVRAAHVFTAGRSSQVLLAGLRRTPGWVDAPSTTATNTHTDPAVVAAVETLRTDGVITLDRSLPPIADPTTVDGLVAFARSAPGRARLSDGSRVRATHDHRPAETSTLFVDGSFSYANEHVQAVLANPTLLAIARAYLGATPVVQTPTFYWTYPSADLDDSLARTQARWFHLDYDGLAAVRLHLYLTDVDDSTGPMEYVIGTHRPGTLGGRGWWRSDDGLPEQQVTDRFGTAAVRAVTGPAGTAFISDSHGLHRGTAPRTAARLFMVVPISAGSFATYVQRKRSVPVRNAEFDRLIDDPTGPLRLFTRMPADAADTVVPVARIDRSIASR
jgi:hypothetical protein